MSKIFLEKYEFLLCMNCIAENTTEIIEWKSFSCLHSLEDWRSAMHVCFIRNHFISNRVLDSLKFKKLSDLQRKSLETLDK